LLIKIVLLHLHPADITSSLLTPPGQECSKGKRS
jgi:hypothetical protein